MDALLSPTFNFLRNKPTIWVQAQVFQFSIEDSVDIEDHHIINDVNMSFLAQITNAAENQLPFDEMLITVIANKNPLNLANSEIPFGHFRRSSDSQIHAVVNCSTQTIQHMLATAHLCKYSGVVMNFRLPDIDPTEDQSLPILNFSYVASIASDTYRHPIIR